uniref:Cytochrome c oxidase subunit 3 n=1 Tax=Olavius algarvensis TaxID=188229 RepID=A0A7R9NFV9_9ANNE|nr:COX3 CDS [Olavius algarvensis]
MTQQPYHLVEPSPWPMMSALSSMFIALGLINWLHFNSMYLLQLGLMLMLMSLFQWWRDMVREATYMGKHTSYVQSGLRLGMMLFIISEICFFMAFFWAFFHSSLAPCINIGCTWPPIGIKPIDPFSVPLLNTTVLLASGFTVTWAHHSLLMKKRMKTMMALSMTIMLGMYFTMLQLMEYNESSFTIADSVYGSIFFIATGFHGIHVLIGTSFLLINMLRTMKSHFSNTHHFGFEASAWYWHFVDVIWICLYMSIYWWGSL